MSLFEKAESCSIIAQSNKMRNYEDLKKNSSSFFKRIRNLCSVNLKTALAYLEGTFLRILKSNDINSIANVYFLLAEFCDNTLF